MAKDIIKKRKQDLGIFYTPQEVVDFIFDILNIWKNKADKETHRWQTRKPKAHYPSVIDPACGEGVFLKTAVTSGFTGYHPTEKTPYVFGVDMDGDVVKRWEEISILNDLFKGNREKMLNHFHQQNGLVELPNKVFNYKTGGLKEFDAIVGNPPYGGLGIYDDMKQLLQAVYQTQKVTSVENQVFDTLLGEQEVKQIKVTKNIESKIDISKERLEELKEISKSLLQYDVWKDEKLNIRRTDYSAMINGLSFNLKHLMDVREIDRLKSFPIEILFVDRFIQLAKPGGWVAIIIPDGILANSNSHYVRQFISDKAKVEAIVSLPRETFKNVGTNAKTSILFLKKYEPGEKKERVYPVFLASVEKMRKDQFNTIVNSYEKIYNSRKDNMDNLNDIQITSDQNKNETVMVRVDKTLKQLMEEKPASRWDPEYWHPKHALNFGGKAKLRQIGDFLEYITYGTILTGKDRDFTKSGVSYISSTTVTDTGINHHLNSLYVNSDDRRNKKDKKPQVGDIILNRSGVGTLGRQCVFTYSDNNWTISDDTDLIRLVNISPYYVSIFLKTKFGLSQIEQRMRGVSGLIKLNFEDIKAITIPELSPNIQKNIENKYKQMAEKHDEAIHAKTKGDQNKYDEDLGVAKKMLDDLVKITEEVIEGKREDVN